MYTKGACDELKKRYDECFAEWRQSASLTDLLSGTGGTLHKCETLHSDYRDCCAFFLKVEIERRKKEREKK